MAILTRNPTSDISATGDWSGTAGSRWELVDDYPSTSTGDQLTHGTTAGRILFGYGTISLPSIATITSVKILYYDREASNGPNNVAAALQIGGADYSASTHNPGTTTTLRTDTFTTNPRTGVAWTADDINGAGSNGLTGFGLVSTDANPAVSITSIQMEVDYTLDYPLIANTGTFTLAGIANDFRYFNLSAETGHYGVSGKGVNALDAYPGAVAAYSLRKLRSDYSGSCIRVLRDSDFTQEDIGFGADGFLDEDALTTFVGSGTGTVTTWYDQGPNGWNAVGQTTFPRIVNAGTIDRSNDKIAIWFSGETANLYVPGLNLTSGDSSHQNMFRNVHYAHMFSVARSTTITSTTRTIFGALANTNAARARIGHWTGAGESVNGRRLDGETTQHVGPATVPRTTQFLYSGLLNYIDATAGLWLNGVLAASSTNFRTAGRTSDTVSTQVHIGRINATTLSPWVGYIQEIIAYNTDQGQNRTALETNINADWEVYSDASTATLSYGKTMTAEAGAFALTGEDVTLTVVTQGLNLTITAESAAFYLTGHNVTFVYEYNLAADLSSYTMTGQDAGLIYGLRVNAVTGTYALTGQTAALTKVSIYSLTADSATYTLAGQDVVLVQEAALTMFASHGDFVISGNDIILTYSNADKVMSTVVGSYIFTGFAAEVIAPPNYSAGGLDTLPTFKGDLPYIYRAADRAAVAALDGSAVQTRGHFAIHQYQFSIAPGSATQIRWKGTSSLASNLSTVYFQLWNVSTETWDQIATDVITGAGSTISLFGAIPSNSALYIDANNRITARVWQGGAV